MTCTTKICGLIALAWLGLLSAAAQSVSTLQSGYTGTTAWDAPTGTLTFKTTGTMNFTGRQTLTKNTWYMPAEVKAVVIAANVTVTGEFYAEYTCTIVGQDKTTSVVFGTPQQDYLGLTRGLSAFSAADSKARDVVLTVRNLTSLNPKVYHFTGSYRGIIHLDNCRVIDNRGGTKNNSDGYQSANGGTVKNCYFETSEDVIKAYNNITVENTTIKMITFSVPIQCGWGDYGSGITARFKNLTIIGNGGRAPDNAFIEARQGSYTKNIIIEGLTLTNPNAALFRLQQASATIHVTITNASVQVKKYGDVVYAKGTRSICGTTQKKNTYECRTAARTILPEEPESLPTQPASFYVVAEPAQQQILIRQSAAVANTRLYIYDSLGKLLHTEPLSRSEQVIRSTSLSTPGIYFLTLTTPGQRFTQKLVIQ